MFISVFVNRLLCLFIKYFSVKIEQLKCNSRSGPLTSMRKKVVHWLGKVDKYCFRAWWKILFPLEIYCVLYVNDWKDHGSKLIRLR